MVKARWALSITIVLALNLPAGAAAADSHAPSGARADWLPASEWVMSSWLPYDQARLERLLEIDEVGLRAWLDDRRTLAGLGRERGWSRPSTLAAALVAPRLKQVPARMRPVLRRRAMDTLTQPHLARHVFFHVYHSPAVPNAAREIFGVSPTRFRGLRDLGWSPQRIGESEGRTPLQIIQGLDRVFERRANEAVRGYDMSRRQADRLLATQRWGFGAFIARAYRTPEQQEAFVCQIAEAA